MGEVEKRLSSKVDTLKAELASKTAELESVHQGQQASVAALCAQIIDANKSKETALGAL
jgi:hypothetical protein